MDYSNNSATAEVILEPDSRIVPEHLHVEFRKMVHDFQNLMGVVQGYAEMIQISNTNNETGVIDPVLDRRAANILSATHRATKTIREMSRKVEGEN